ncbi:uncharacterized protein [Rutidosis leptorrhynchoides]|uniref:uncharacterized protein n=1 Tax=Rutidosis leptorrhynchoides TaxID=125765 RepID=UPI003A996EED
MEFSNISQRVEMLRSHVHEVQKKVQVDPCNAELLYEECAFVIAYKELLLQERDFFCQKSRVMWMREGDDNTSFFHNSIRIRNAYLFGTNNHGRSHLLPDIVSRGPILLEEDAGQLCGEVTDANIYHALYDINNNKAPGVDGFNAFFFKSNWQLVGPAVLEAVHSFFALAK